MPDVPESMVGGGQLVVLRGNSGSGESTVARTVQSVLSEGACAVIEQDWVRREVVREPDVAGGLNIALIEQMAATCLAAGRVVVVEGILNAHRYGGMLARLYAAHPGRCHFYAWDLTLTETVRRHATRPQAADFTAEEMRSWYHGWQPLHFVEEVRLDHEHSLQRAVDLILTDLHDDGPHSPTTTPHS